MNREARDATLATFKKPGGPKVILIRYGPRDVRTGTLVDSFFTHSTKAGSVG
jgi:hypothetical protein